MGSLLSVLEKISGVKVFHSVDSWQRHLMAVKDSRKMVIDFATSRRGPCKFIEPAVRSMVAKFPDVQFVKIDVNELPDVSREFGIEAMPTFVFVKRGKEVDRVIGADKDELEKTVAKHREASTTRTSSPFKSARVRRSG